MIRGLQQEIQFLSDELHEASPAQKPAIAAAIKALHGEISTYKSELQQCIKDHPNEPDPESEPLPKECEAIRQQINKLSAKLSKEVQEAVSDLQEDLHGASPAQKADIVKKIKQITEDIRTNSPTAQALKNLIRLYNRCIEKNDGLPALNAVFRGRSQLSTSNDNAPGPYSQDIAVRLWFSEWDHGMVIVTDFPDIVVSHSAGTTTVSERNDRISGGTFNRSTDRLTLNLFLDFRHSSDFIGDSTLDISLVTSTPMDNAGFIVLEGSAQFEGGGLDEDWCWLKVEGTITPRPGV